MDARVHELGSGEGHFFDWARAKLMGTWSANVDVTNTLVRQVVQFDELVRDVRARCVQFGALAVEDVRQVVAGVAAAW